MSSTLSGRSTVRVVASIAVLFMIAPLSAAAPAPRTTPSSIKPPTPKLLGKPAAASILASLQHKATAAEASPKVAMRNLDTLSGVDDLFERSNDIGDTLYVDEQRRSTTTACLDSTATDVEINSVLYYGGPGTIVSLCPGAVISLTNSIFFTDANQEISTQGYPTDNTRAKLVVTGSDQSCAIYGPCDKCQNIALRNIQVDGSRPTLGWMSTGIALIEMGGNTVGQMVDHVHAFEPRGWSVLHGIEGYENSCSGMLITNNQIGPSGNSPNNGYQFKRDNVYAPGQWADGISLACKASRVIANTVTDATDGMIVIFGAPGSQIMYNTLISQTRVALGGINAVDFGPFNGPYTGTVVQGNTIISDTSMIKVGIAIGGMVWGSDNRTASRTFDGEFIGNTLKSGSTGYFGYGIAVAGHDNAVVLNNDASGAKFGATQSQACIPVPMVPTPQAFVFDQWTTPSATLQNNFVDNPLVFLICNGPGPIATVGVSSVLNTAITIINGLNGLLSAPKASTTTTTTTTTAAATTTTVAVIPVTTTAPIVVAAVPTTTTTTTTTSSFVPKAKTKGVVAFLPTVVAKAKPKAKGNKRDIMINNDEGSQAPLGRATPVAGSHMINPFLAAEQQKMALKA